MESLKYLLFKEILFGNKSDKTDLFDSISKEYPIGSIMLWQPNYEFDSNGKIGPYTIDNSKNKDFFYVLDGFQRLSTLFGCLTNASKTILKFDEANLHAMADVHNKKTRSYNMSQIKATDTKPELLLRKFLNVNGFRYKLHDKTLPGKPDIIS